MKHIAIALVIQAVLAQFMGWWAAGVASVAVFVSREVTQAEYRWIEHFGHGFRVNMPWHTPYTDRRAWTRKGVTDFVYPAIACSLAALAAQLISKV